jgi:hypothetical protein
MLNRLKFLERQLIEYKKRSCVSIDVIEENSSPWNTFLHDHNILRPDVVELIEHAFDCGGFIAGGCGRWLRSVGQITPVKRGVYVHEGGDIDLFFKTPASWSEFISLYSENQCLQLGTPCVRLSDGKLAANISFASNGICHGYNRVPNVQAIRCVTGTPEEVILDFDFVNSMVAFDRNRVWVASKWEELEHSKKLGVVRWDGRSIAFRVKKYMMKYGYKSLEDLSEGQMLEQLIIAINTMDETRKPICHDIWLTVVNMIDIPLETKLTILASTANGIDTKDICNITQSHPYNVGAGSYENTYESLLNRDGKLEKSKWLNFELLEKVFNADEYCWAR